MLNAIYLPQLAQAPDRTEVVQVEDVLPDWQTLTPVKGRLEVVHHGNYLQVSAEVETIMTLKCDRCLQHYNYRLSEQLSELIWLEVPKHDSSPTSSVVDISLEELVEAVSPQDYFDPGDWLYQQLCLALPPRQLCDSNCTGMISEQDTQTLLSNDSRWAALAALKEDLGKVN